MFRFRLRILIALIIQKQTVQLNQLVILSGDPALQTMLAALNIATGKATTWVNKTRKSADFVTFMNKVVQQYPNQRLHVVMDNLNTHKGKATQAWLEDHPEVAPQFRKLWSNIGELEELVDLLERAILEEPAIQINEGNLIKPGYDVELDRMRDVKENARKLLKAYLDEERGKTGIPSLKLKYNRIIGYFLEVSKSNLKSVPPYFIRRQTLVGGERFSTEELSDLESEIHNASEQIVELERKHFLAVRASVREHLDRILRGFRGYIRA